jgi:cytidylate kinase
VAKMLSRYYKVPFVDSGALYRGITFLAIEEGFLTSERLDEDSLSSALKHITMEFDIETGDLHLNNLNITEKIRSPFISDHVSKIASLTYVRDFVLRQLRLMSQERGLVMDGRDIGTVVFPNADHKFFLTARPEIRAQRRFEELKSKNQKTSFEEVLNNLIHRDKADSRRAIAPLRKADDAIEVDTSDLSTDQVFNLLTERIGVK